MKISNLTKNEAKEIVKQKLQIVLPRDSNIHAGIIFPGDRSYSDQLQSCSIDRNLAAALELLLFDKIELL